MEASNAHWAEDMIEVEAKKAYPGELTKEQIQEATGIGPGDLRSVIASMLDANVIQEGEDGGYLYVDPLDRKAAIGQRPEAGAVDDGGDAESDAEAGEGETPGNALEGPERSGGVAIDTSGTRYRALILIEVEYQPEPDEDEPPDEAALREAENDLLVAAANGVLADYPGLAVKPRLLKLEAYGTPRTVYPAS